MGTGAGCFPSGSIVHTQNGPRDIASLKKGDKVLAADDDGKMVYSEVNLSKYFVFHVVFLTWRLFLLV